MPGDTRSPYIAHAAEMRFDAYEKHIKSTAASERFWECVDHFSHLQCEKTATVQD